MREGAVGGVCTEEAKTREIIHYQDQARIGDTTWKRVVVQHFTAFSQPSAGILTLADAEETC